MLGAAKLSIETPFAAQIRQKMSFVQSYKNLLLAIESIRIPLTAGAREHAEPDELLRVAHEVYQLRKSVEYADILRGVRFRMSSTLSQNSTLPHERYYGRFAGNIKVIEALEILESLLLENEDPSTFPSGEVISLKRIVPDQKIAPLQFTITDSKIAVLRRVSPSRAADVKNIESARAELQRNGDKIISELEQSNCDKRLLASLQELQAQFQGEIDAIKMGLMNIGCETMCNAFDAELPLALSSMLRAHTRGVQMFIGQFPDWTAFVENAAAADLNNADVEELKVASAKVVSDLAARPDLVSPEVPRTLKALTEMLNSPSQSSKRAAFAVLRSFENLVSRVFGYGATFLEKTAEKTVDRASTAASAVIVGMLLLGVSGAIAIGPLSSKIPDMNWVKTAADIVKKQLDELAKK
ncbi:MAG: hypothetical protein ABIL01_29685 [Pseudomonadota bacterium]